MTNDFRAGTVPALYVDMLKQPHLLIGGATGSGKSVAVQGLLYTSIRIGLPAVGWILIDPKRVELSAWKRDAHCIRYASEPDDMIRAISYGMEIIEKRYRQMQREGSRMYTGGHIYIVIDEFADLMTTDKKRVKPLIQRIAQVGRAARVHLILCTQCPLVTIIPTEIKVNFDARLALRTRSAQDSRNLIGVAGCETLPRYGYGYYYTADGLQRVQVPYIPPDVYAASIRTRRDWQRRTRWKVELHGLK